MKFKQFGRSCQLDLDSPESLRHILQLDESLWAATSAPISALRADSTFLAYLDQDDNGRINTRDVCEAVRWTLARLVKPDGLAAGRSSLQLAEIEGAIVGGAAVLDSARYILAAAGTPDAEEIDLKAVKAFLTDLDKQARNGDGIVVPEAAEDPETMAFIQDVIVCTGGLPDAGGSVGVSPALCAGLCEGARAYTAWQAEREADDGDAILTLGTDTPQRYAVYAAHAAAIDRFFAVCGTLSFNAPVAEPMTRPLPAAAGVDLSLPTAINGYLGAQLIAAPTDDGALPLKPSLINPAYRDWVQALRERVLAAVTRDAPDVLSFELWQTVKRAMAPYSDYLSRRPDTPAAQLSTEQRQRYAQGDWLERIAALSDADTLVSQIKKSARELEKLLLYHAHLLRLVNNFVSFSQLYDPAQRALFEMGSAVIDGRWFSLAFRVDDITKHLAMAKSSNLFVLYLEVTAHDGTPAYTVAVPSTSGSRGNLGPAKRGVFFDVDGREFDARVSRILENPISIREALVAPFVRLWGFVLGRIESMSTSSEKALQQNTDALLQMPATPPATGAPPSAGMLMGLSVSVAAVGSAFAFIAKSLAALHPYQIAASLMGAALVVMVPVTLIAILKLSRQDLSSLLEACGWAVNSRMRPSREQRKQFTCTVPYPVGATGTPRSRLTLHVLLVLLGILLLTYGCTAARRRAARPLDTAPPPTATLTQQ